MPSCTFKSILKTCSSEESQVIKETHTWLLYKITVRSILEYCLPVYFNFLNAKQKVKLEETNLYTAAKSGALYNTSRFSLNNELV